VKITRSPLPNVSVTLTNFESSGSPTRGRPAALPQNYQVEEVRLHEGAYTPNREHELIGQGKDKIPAVYLDPLALCAAGLTGTTCDELLFGPEASDRRSSISTGRINESLQVLGALNIAAATHTAFEEGLFTITQRDPEELYLGTEDRYVRVLLAATRGEAVADTEADYGFSVQHARRALAEDWDISTRIQAAVTRAHLTGLLPLENPPANEI
jgi:hypothetical protein